MVGITLSPEQIRAAPPMVREWLQHEINTSLGVQSGASMESPAHLVACTPQEAMTIFSAIRGMLPVSNVFFELGRQGESINQQGLEAFRLADMVRHTRLPGVRELSSCLDLIDQAFQQIRGDATVTLYAVDPTGYCIVAEATQRSIMAVWNEMVAAQSYSMPVAPGGASMEFNRPPAAAASEGDGKLPDDTVRFGEFPGPAQPAMAAQSGGADRASSV